MRVIATIRTAIQIQDGLSNAFRSMNIAMQSTINSFEHLQEASGNAVDTSSIEIARRELARAESAFNDIEQEIRQAEQAQDELNNSIRDGTSAAGGLLGKIGGVVAAYLSFRSANGLLSMADEMANTAARLDIMNDGLMVTETLQQRIFESAKRTYAPFKETADMISKLGILAGDAFRSNNEIIDFTEQLNKHFVISGTSAQGVQSVMLQLTQAMAGGVLRGEELNSVFENAPTLIQNISDYLGVTKGEIRDLASEGEITAEIVKQALFAAADETNARFESMPNTFKDVWTNAITDITQIFQPFFSRLTEISDSKKFQTTVDDLVNSLNTLAIIAVYALDTMVSMAEFVYDNWTYLEPAIVTATIALLGYGTAQLWVNRQKIISTVLTATETIRKWAFVFATIAQTAATYGLTGAMAALGLAIAANPIGWLIGAIVVLVLIFYAAVAAVNHFAGTSVSATGVIAGVFMAALAIIANAFIYLWNIAVEVFSVIYNIAVDVSEGLVNIFSGDLTAIARMFIDLADTALGALGSIAKGFDFVLGTDFASSVDGWRNGLNNWSASVIGENRIKFDRMDPSDWQLKTIDTVAAYGIGYNWGSNLFSSNENQPHYSDYFGDSQALLDAIEAGNLANKDTAGNTKKLADSVDMAAEDLKYMRDIAERDTINRYTTAQIKVDMKNENHISSDMDIDGVIDRFGERVEEVADMLAEGGGEDV